MPSWLPLALQILEAILQVVLANKPAPTAMQAEHDDHAATVAKLQSAIDALK